MEVNQSHINSLIANPSESLNVEIKRWISPDENENKGFDKIVKAVLAIHNRNGGYVLIGFDDETLLPDTTNPPPDVRSLFHLDKIQGLVSKYASEQIEVKVGFGIREEQEYPVIVIPEGVKTPVAAKRDSCSKNLNENKPLIREGAIYFRTLKANGTPSTAVAKPDDWKNIVNICFDNREADIGRFLRLHALEELKCRASCTSSGSEGASLVHSEDLTKNKQESTALKDKAQTVINEGEQRFQLRIKERQFAREELEILSRGTWSVALVIDPPISKASADRNFLNTVMGANPQYTGWPIWLDSRGFQDQTAKPQIIEGVWETLILGMSGPRHYDFMRLIPKGEFYLRRILQDDVTDRVPPEKALDPLLMIIRVAEAIAVGLSIAKALNVSNETRLGFAFRWTKMKGRELSVWAHPMVLFNGYGTANDNEVNTFVELPVDTPLSAIAPYVDEATRELFVIFGGYRFSIEVIEHWVQHLIERRL